MTEVSPSPQSAAGESAPRRGRLWPLLAMASLVLLLTAFLVLRWHRRDAAPIVVKEPPRPATPEVRTTPPPVEPAPRDPKEESYAAALKEAVEALEAKHWDEAEAAVKKARGFFDRPKLKELEDQVQAGRDSQTAAVKAEADAKRRQEAGWVETRDRVRTLRDESKWDEAVAALEKLAQDFPKILQDQRYLDARKDVQDLREAADKEYVQSMADAEKAFAEERYSAALQASRQAGRNFPARQPAVKAFQDRVNEAILKKTMVRVNSNVACVIGGEQTEDEKPVRTVKLEPFYIDKYKVTNEDYYAFVTATDRAVPAHWIRRKPPQGREKHPVVFVAYADAEAYAQWAGKRLPTADEWEVAARGPDKREYPWGNAFTEKENVFHCNCVEYWQITKNPPGTLPVDAFDAANSASFYGVYGMGGNVWEWTSSTKKRKLGDKEEEFRVLKGGSFMTGARAIRSANVLPEDPNLALPDVGFRCVRDVK